MNISSRRAAVLQTLQDANVPVSATKLAAQFGVSRQIIVGDIALLRAQGELIAATPRGYIITKDSTYLIRTVACCHESHEMEQELNIIVDHGCVVRDVIVEHPVYGQLAGQLALKSRYDVQQFIIRVAESDAAPLSALTDGIHLHTLLCPDEESFLRVRDALQKDGFLLPEQED